MRPHKIRLGDLEMAVLEHLWSVREGTVRTVHHSVGEPRDVSYNTVQSTLERLYRKSLLVREKAGHAFVYQAAVTRSELMSRYIDEVIETFSNGRTGDAVAAFVDWIDRADTETLDRLEAKLAAKRAQLGKGRK
jgi:predicted transcriptional regulator